jgi:hypothetical protein
MICCTVGLRGRKMVCVSSAQNSVSCFHIQVSQFITHKSIKCCIDEKKIVFRVYSSCSYSDFVELGKELCDYEH